MEVESLSSFVARLCVARSLTAADVFDVLVRPLVHPKVLPARPRLSYFLTGSAVEFDGMGATAAQMVRALEQLTGREGLVLHTFLPWRGLFSWTSSGALMRGGKRWCPLCFEDQRAAGGELWEPLLWRLAPATRCPKHFIRYHASCSHCGRAQRVLSQAVPIGFCEYCSTALWRTASSDTGGAREVREDPEAEWEWWTTFALGRMVAAQDLAIEQADTLGLSLLLDRSRDKYGDGAQALHSAATSTKPSSPSSIVLTPLIEEQAPRIQAAKRPASPKSVAAAKPRSTPVLAMQVDSSSPFPGPPARLAPGVAPRP